MEDEGAKDLRVPIIASIFCLCVTTGGAFLIAYVFFPNASKPWFPIIALVLIGSPWLFWLFTYIYTCMKGCGGGGGGGRGATAQIPQRQATMNASTSSATNGNGGNQQSSSVASSRESEFPLAYSV